MSIFLKDVYKTSYPVANSGTGLQNFTTGELKKKKKSQVAATKARQQSSESLQSFFMP